MKYSLFIGMLLLSASSVYGQEMMEFEKIIQSESQAFQQKIQFRSNPLTATYDVKYHRFEWEIDPSVRYIKGAVTTVFQSVTDGLNELYFDLSAALTVDSVVFRNQKMTFEKLPGDLLRIQLSHIVPDFGIDSLTIYYQGVPPSTGFGSFEQRNHGPSNTPVIWTLSEPFGAKDWRPCKQDLYDKADSIDVLVTTPAAYRAASNGILHREWQNGSTKKYHWKHRYPIPAYLIAIAVTNYAVYSDFATVPNGQPIEILNYVYPENLIAAQSQTPQTARFMELFNELVGLYPYADEKYGHAQCGFGGGMEHTTMSFMGGFSNTLIAHELAHQWFGDKITCGSWQHIWLNEGFATYLEGLTFEHGLRFGEWRDWLRDKVNNITSLPDGSVYVPDTTVVGRIFNGRLTYNKGSMLLHMLRWKLGDEDFYQAVRNYLEDPQLAYGFAKTADLQRHLELKSGQDLDEFFADWFYGEGHPVYKVSWWHYGQNRIRIQLDQQPSHPSVNFFEMPVPVQLKGQGRDTIVVLDHVHSGQIFTMNVGFAVDEIVFDPDIWLVAKVDQLILGDGELQLPEAAVEFFPNPVKEELAITITQPGYAITGFQIFDTSGNLIRKESILSSFSHLIKTNSLDSGVYLLQLDINGKPACTKLFIKI